jgi:hypothetical protein
MSALCRFSDALGEPNKGVHAPRIAGLAAFDLLGTAGLAFLISRYGFRDSPFVLAFVLTFIVLILAAILLHESFCVNTRLNALIFGREWPKKEKDSTTPTLG